MHLCLVLWLDICAYTKCCAISSDLNWMVSGASALRGTRIKPIREYSFYKKFENASDLIRFNGVEFSDRLQDCNANRKRRDSDRFKFLINPGLRV